MNVAIHLNLSYDGVKLQVEDRALVFLNDGAKKIKIKNAFGAKRPSFSFPQSRDLCT